MITYALRENINLFYPPGKIVAGEAPVGKRIRAGGCVVPGSVIRQQKNLAVEFTITDGNSDLLVKYEGILPDLFAEDEAVVVHGKVTRHGHFTATEVLAKHDENYMPPEVAEAMQNTGEHAKTCDLL